MSSNPLAEDILKFRGGLARNNLIEILKNVEDIDTTIFHAAESPYVDVKNASDFLTKYKNNFTLLNLNIQSLNAKFDVFVIFLQELAASGVYFSVISLQETWVTQHLEMSKFLLPNYNITSLDASCSSHGGLVTYVHKSFQFTRLDLYTPTPLWEGIFLEISGGGLSQSITLCNIYRPLGI